MWQYSWRRKLWQGDRRFRAVVHSLNRSLATARPLVSTTCSFSTSTICDVRISTISRCEPSKWRPRCRLRATGLLWHRYPGELWSRAESRPRRSCTFFIFLFFRPLIVHLALVTSNIRDHLAFLPTSLPKPTYRQTLVLVVYILKPFLRLRQPCLPSTNQITIKLIGHKLTNHLGSRSSSQVTNGLSGW